LIQAHAGPVVFRIKERLGFGSHLLRNTVSSLRKKPSAFSTIIGISNGGFANCCLYAIFVTMSTVKEIEEAIPRLTRAEVEQLREWIEDYLEDQLELTDEVKSKLDQSRGEIAAGQFTTRRPG